MLGAQGYALVEREEEADVILLNTCSVRAHAEERAFGKMGLMQRLKRERPDLVLGILGCMAKAQREEVFRRLPQVDLVAGPAEIYDLPDLLAGVAERASARAGPAGRPAPRRRPEGAAARPPAGRPTIGRGGVDRVRDDHGGLRQEVRLLHRAHDAGPGGVAADRRDPRRGPAARARRLPPGHAPRPERELVRQALSRRLGLARPGRRRALRQLEARLGPEGGGRPSRLVDFPVLLRAIDGKTSIERVRFTTSHPVRRPRGAVPGDGGLPVGLRVPPPARPVGLGPDASRDAARLHRGRVPREARAAPRAGAGRGALHGHHRGLPGRDRGRLRGHAGADGARAVRQRVRLQVLAPAGHRGRRPAGRRPAADQGATQPGRCSSSRAASPGESSERWVGREVEVLVEERNRRGQLAGQEPPQHDRSSSTAPTPSIGELVPVRVGRVTGTTMIGEPAPAA